MWGKEKSYSMKLKIQKVLADMKSLWRFTKKRKVDLPHVLAIHF